MTDLTFIARVAAMLLAAPGPAQRAWSQRRRLQAVARDCFGADPEAAAWLAEAAERPSPHLVPPLTGALRRAAEEDPEFAAAVRQLVVDAYAEPGLAFDLPDPAPGMN